MTQPTKARPFATAACKVALLAVGLISTACSDTSGPGLLADDLPVADGSMHQHLRWATPPSADQFSAVANLPEGSIELTRHQNPMTSFDGEWFDWDGEDVFSVSFYAVRGEEREINVELDTDTETLKFLELEITEPTYRPDGSPIAVGDSVLITVTIDPTSLAVDLQPSGIQFGSNYPTELELSYKAAGMDLNADGAVSKVDYYIKNNLLGVWMQEHAGDPWVFMLGDHDPDAREFEVLLEHFSGYAVSW